MTRPAGTSCPTCSGRTRETVGMVCQTCGTDYGAAEAGDLRGQIERLIADDQAGGWQESLPEDLAKAILSLPEMRALVEQPAVDCGHHSWAGLMALLDEHWPEDLFPTRADDPARDAGPRIVSLLRWVNQLLRQSMEGAGR